MSKLSQQSKEVKDERIAEAKAIEDMIKSKGYEILLREYEIVKANALRDLLDERLDNDSLKFRQLIHNQVSELINIPQVLIKEGVIAIEEAKEELPETLIKENVPYLGRRT